MRASQHQDTFRLAEARRLYFDASFDECITRSRAIDSPEVEDQSEVALLVARCLIRLSRFDEAEQELLAAIKLHISLDAKLTSQMLLAATYIRRGNTVDGLELLRSADTRALKAHPTIRSEIALNEALGHWVDRNLDAAQACIRRVNPNTDIIHARALELQGFCFLTRDRLRDAARSFSSTLLRLDGCRQRDNAIAAKATQALAQIGYDTNDAELIRSAHSRYSLLKWTDGIAEPRFLTEHYLAEANSFAGDHDKAFGFGFLALENATSGHYRATAYAALVHYSDRVGNAALAKAFAERANRLIRSINDADFDFSGRESCLVVAAACAKYDVNAARKLFIRFLKLPADPQGAATGTKALRAEETYTEGIIFGAEGNVEAAARLLQQAHGMYEETERVARATIAASALAKLTGDLNMAWYVASVSKGAETWLDNGISLDSSPNNFPATTGLARLSKTQREVADLICQGKSNREIARMRGVQVQTIKNMLSGYIFKELGVSTRAELMTLLINGGSTIAPDTLLHQANSALEGVGRHTQDARASSALKRA